MTRPELEQFQTLLDTLRDAHASRDWFKVDVCSDWLEAAVKQAKKQLDQERARFEAYGS